MALSWRRLLSPCAQGTFIGGLCVGFYYSWKLTLVIMSFLPLMMIGGGFMQVCVCLCSVAVLTACCLEWHYLWVCVSVCLCVCVPESVCLCVCLSCVRVYARGGGWWWWCCRGPRDTTIWYFVSCVPVVL